jgi:uncharacterized protein YoxC
VELTTLDNVAIGMMLVLALIALIYVVWNCAKIEKRQDELEKSINLLQCEVNTHSLTAPHLELMFPDSDV